VLKKIGKWLNSNFEMSVSVILLSALTLILFVQVIARRVFGHSLTWSEEAARYIFIWLIFFAISYGAKIEKHIKIEAFLKFFPKAWRSIIIIIGDFLFLAFAVYLVYIGFVLVGRQIQLGQISPANHIPMALVYAGPPIGFVFTSVRKIQVIIRHIKKVSRGESLNG
jgi:TRAP-type C4-dicarboxylate transport system permease small subunit